MALVGHISGSSQSSSWIGVSGSVIVANRPDALFPAASAMGTDVSFFVSGSLDGKGKPERTVSVFGGDVHISGSLTVGTGSVTITSNDIRFGTLSNRIQLDGSNNIVFFDSNNTSGRTLSSLVTSSPAGSANQVQYNDGSSLQGNSYFTFVPTGNLEVGPSSQFRLVVSSGNLQTAGTLTVNGATTLSSTADVTGNLNVNTNKFQVVASSGNTTVAGTLGVTAAATLSSTADITGNLNVNTNKFQVVASSGNTTVAGTLGVTGATTLSSTADVTGNLNVNTNKFQVVASSGNTTVAGTLGVAGAATLSSTADVTGNLNVNTSKFQVVASSGNTTVAGTLGVAGAATLSSTLGVTGNLAVNSNKFNVIASSGNTSVAGTLDVTAAATLSSTLAVTGQTTLNGNLSFGASSLVVSNIIPSLDVTYTLGSPTKRWQHVYTGDLHLRNDRGDYTLIEEEEFLSIRFNKTGKRYKFLLEPVPELDEQPVVR